MRTATATAVLALAASSVAQDLGQIDFPTSARGRETQATFVRGVLLLHSFEYDDARTEFVRAQRAEPGFAMAYWGEAMTFCHPVWRREELEQGRAALAKLAPTAAERAAAAPTDIEKGWLRAVEALFGEGTRAVRWTAYSSVLGELHARHPHDVEVAAFYALSILGTSFGGRDERVFMRAAAVAQPFWARYPDHPGLLHYLIHCFDDPVHAPLGLPMARSYDRIAPAAGHALHMPSHIYVALGMWDEAVAANVRAFAASDARRQRLSLPVDDRDWHSCQWLAYAHLQRGELAAAERCLELVRTDHSVSQTPRMRTHLVVVRAAQLVDTSWAHPAGNLEIDLAGLRSSTAAADHFARGMAALAANDVARAEQAAQRLRALAPRVEPSLSAVRGQVTCCAPSGERPETVQDQLAVMVMGAQLDAALLLTAGRDDAAMAALRLACQREDAMGFDFGPPVVPKPAHEQLGELLLRGGDAAGAAAEFAAALQRAPRRSRSLLGLGRAQRAAGNADAALSAYRELDAIWHGADANLPDRDEVRNAAAATTRAGN